MGMGRAVTHNPKDGIGGVDKKKLTLFVEQAELMVGEEIAEELGTMGHAERLETVALTPMTQGERQTDGVGIEKGLGGRQRARIEGEVGDGDRLKMDLGQEFGGRGSGEGSDEESVAIENGAMGGGIEAAAGAGGSGDGGDGGRIEAQGVKHFEQQLEAQIGLGKGGQEVGEVEGEPERAIGEGGKQLFGERLEQGLIEMLGRLEVGDGGGDGAVGSGLQLTEEREQLVAHLVAAVVEGGIGEVFHMVEVVAGGIGFDVVAAKRKQGTDHMGLHRQDAMETGKASAAEKIEEEGLVGIVAVVGGEESRIAMRLAEGEEPVVAQTTGSILDAELMGVGVVEGLKVLHMEGNTILQSQIADKKLVAVAVARTQVEIAVGNGEGVVGTVHEMGEDHRVDTSANSKQHLLSRGEEVLLSHMCYELLKHYLRIILRKRR